jgi:pimeloyl-ACP methyl ester carboxylesterase
MPKVKKQRRSKSKKNVWVAAIAFSIASGQALAAEHQVPRVYLMRGLLELSPFSTLVAKLKARGAIVTTWSWMQREAVVADALRHRGDRIVVAGHSMGDQEAFTAGAELKARGLRATIVGLDPLCTSPRATPGLSQINIWGNGCMGRAASVAAAKNIYLPGPSHIGYPADPRVQALFVKFALSL